MEWKNYRATQTLNIRLVFAFSSGGALLACCGWNCTHWTTSSADDKKMPCFDVVLSSSLSLFYEARLARRDAATESVCTVQCACAMRINSVTLIYLSSSGELKGGNEDVMKALSIKHQMLFQYEFDIIFFYLFLAITPSNGIIPSSRCNVPSMQ